MPALPHPSAHGHSLQDRCILITGAGRGIGKRVALGFASCGARIGLLARTQTELDITDLEIESNQGRSLRLRADVRRYEEVAAAVDRLRNTYGAIHGLVCAAGIAGPIGPFVDADPRSAAEAVEVNLLGAMNACRAVLPHMLQRRSGKIILLAGAGADGARPQFAPYAASKAALVRFAECLAEEVRDYNIQVNCVNPGPTYTAMTDEILRARDVVNEQEFREAARVRTTGGTAHEQQVALFRFLASDRSNHLSGKLLHITDNLRKLEHGSANPDQFTLRRVMKV